ncbi:Chitin synthase, class 1, partial [Rhizoclosmatium hyalinum]
EDRILCFELVMKRDKRYILKYVKSARAETDVPTELHDLIKQRRRWLNGSFFASVYSVSNYYRLFLTKHTFFRMFLLTLETIYNLANIIYSWFSIASIYVCFFFMFNLAASEDLAACTQAVLDSATQDPFFPIGPYMAQATRGIYIASFVSIVVASLGNKPTTIKPLLSIVTIIFGICMALMLTLIGWTVYLDIKNIPPTVKTFSQFIKYVPSDPNFMDLAISLMCTYVMYIVVSIVYLDPWHPFTCLIQYLLMSPSFSNVLMVYAFCNIHDISWGTKGQDTASVGVSVEIHKNEKGKMVATTEVPAPDYATELAKLKEMVAEMKNPHAVVTRSKDVKSAEDHFKSFRTNVLLCWFISNFALAYMLTNEYVIKRMGSPGRANPFLVFLLWSVAGLTGIRFTGATVDDPAKKADYDEGDEGDNVALENHPRPWNDKHIGQVQLLRPSNGRPSDYGRAGWGKPWDCENGDSSDPFEWGGTGFHSSCLLVLVSRVWLKGPSWIQSETQTTNPSVYQTMKAFARWLFDRWDQYGSRIERTFYGIAAPRMKQDWDLFTGEEWLLANPILLPPIYVAGVASCSNEMSVIHSNGGFEPSKTEYFLRLQRNLLASYRLQCQGFYTRSGSQKAPRSLQPISYSPLNQPRYFKCNTISVAPFSKTPDDILLLIIQYLNPSSVSMLEQSHPRFANILRDPPLGSSIWRRFCIAEELVAIYPDGVLRSLHTAEMPMSCDWRRFWIDAATSENKYENQGNLGWAMQVSTPEFASKIWGLVDAAPIDISLALSGSACFDPDLLELMLDKLPDKMTPELKETILNAMGRVCINYKLPSLAIFLNRFPSWINEPWNNENTILLNTAVGMKAYDIVHLLCKSGAKLMRNAKTMESILYEALVFKSNIKMTQILISYGANINDIWQEGAKRPTQPSRKGTVNSGSTLLHLAMVQKNLLAAYFLVKEQGMSINVPDSQGNTALHLAASFLIDSYDVDWNGYDYPGDEYDLCILSSYLADLMKTERIVPKSVVTKFLINYLLEGGYEWANGNVDTILRLKAGHTGPSDFTVLFCYSPGHIWRDLRSYNIWKELKPEMVATICPNAYMIPLLPIHIIQMLIELGADVTAVNKNGQTPFDIAVAGGEGCKMNVKVLEVAMKELKVSA